MFWVYLLGIVLVLGAELNAFLEEPGRSTALAETKAKAEKGQVAVQRQAGGVQTVASGTAAAGGEEPGAAGGQEPSAPARGHNPFAPRRAAQTASAAPAAQPPQAATGSTRPGIGGRLIGLIGLLGAAFLLSRQPRAGEPGQQQP